MSTNLRHDTHRRSTKRKAVALNLSPPSPHLSQRHQQQQFICIPNYKWYCT